MSVTNPRTNRVLGITATLLAMGLFAGQDAITKHLMQSVHITQILVVRYSFFVLFALVLAARRGGIKKAFYAKRPYLQICRGLLIVLEMGMYAYALHWLGLAPTHALFISFPIMITVLSVPLLGESVGWRRWLAVSAGFLGTLLIIKPGVGVFHPAALVALLGALMFALYNLLTRLASRTDSTATGVLYFGLVGLVVSGLSVPLFWAPLQLGQLGWLLMLSATGISGHFLLIKSLELTPAVVLQPFNYTILVWAILIGYLVFDEVLDPLTIAGALIVVLSGLAIARREYWVSRIDIQ